MSAYYDLALSILEGDATSLLALVGKLPDEAKKTELRAHHERRIRVAAEAANLAAANVHAEMVVDTAVAVGDALLKGDHTVYDFFSAVKRFKDRLKLRTPPMESGPVSNTAVSAQEHASQGGAEAAQRLYTKARNDLDNAVALDPENAAVYGERGQTWMND